MCVLCYFDTCGVCVCVCVTTMVVLLIMKVLLISLLPRVSQSILFCPTVTRELNLANFSPLPVGRRLRFASRGRWRRSAGGRAALRGCWWCPSFWLLRRAGCPRSLLHPCAWLPGEFCRQLIRLPLSSREPRGAGIPEASWQVLQCLSQLSRNFNHVPFRQLLESFIVTPGDSFLLDCLHLHHFGKLHHAVGQHTPPPHTHTHSSKI